MRNVLRVLAVFAFAIVALCVRDAYGHAALLESQPSDGEVLARAPAEIVLRFDEPVTPVSLRVLDAAGKPVNIAASGAALESTIRASLPGNLLAGSYLVSWRVVSADSHPVGGAFTFTVGRASAIGAVDDQSRRESTWKGAVIANRAIGDAALLLAAGGAFATLLVFGAVLPRGADTLLRSAAVLAVVSAVLSIPLARGWIAAAPVHFLLEPAAWAFDADAPHRARVTLIVLGLLMAAAGLWRRKVFSGRAGAGVGALVACAGLPLSGHVAALAPALPGQVALFLHTAGAAFWIGALPLLALTVRQSSPAEAHRLLRRFSALAIAIVAVLILAGIGVALTRINNVAALTDSGYGRILLAKAALVGLMLALAIANRRLTRALPSADGAVAARLKRNIGLEIAIAAAVLAVTAWLGHTPPPDETGHTHDAAPSRAFMTVESDGASLLVEVMPGRPGPNRLRGYLTGAHGRPIAPRELSVELSLPEGGIEPLAARARLDGTGTFTVDEIALPLGGRWRMRVDALIGDFEKRVFTLRLEIE